MYFSNNSRFQQFIFACFLLLIPAFLWAQPRFRAGAVAGITASQVDGDLSAGYNKLGLQAGLRVIGRLTQRTDASLEFLFSQRGAQRELIKNKFGDPQYPFTLNYVEVPLQWHYKDWLIEGDDASKSYYKVSFNAGFSYARLISTSVKDQEENPFFDLLPDYLNKNDFSFVLGFNFFANRHLGFTVRYNRRTTEPGTDTACISKPFTCYNHAF
jgi:hypothetical protein